MHPKRLAVLLLVALAGCGSDDAPVPPEVRAAGLRFSPAVTPQDRAWILESIAQARPEARALIEDVDGMVVISTYSDRHARAIGLTTPTAPAAYDVAFNVAMLDTDRKIDRATTVLHEFGHVIDDAVVPVELRDRLAGQLPTIGGCVSEDTGDCTAPAERFADTFAKWALRGAVSAAGVGYGVATPASLEDWGAPLASLAIEIDVAAGR